MRIKFSFNANLTIGWVNQTVECPTGVKLPVMGTIKNKKCIHPPSKINMLINLPARVCLKLLSSHPLTII